MGKCDFCGKLISGSDVKISSPGPIVRATEKGFIPSVLPPDWEQWRGSPALDSSWKRLVNMYSSSNWEICQRCLDELNSFES